MGIEKQHVFVTRSALQGFDVGLGFFKGAHGNPLRFMEASD
jgi:hypothetical protein